MFAGTHFCRLSVGAEEAVLRSAPNQIRDITATLAFAAVLVAAPILVERRINPPPAPAPQSTQGAVQMDRPKTVVSPFFKAECAGPYFRITLHNPTSAVMAYSRDPLRWIVTIRDSAGKAIPAPTNSSSSMDRGPERREDWAILKPGGKATVTAYPWFDGCVLYSMAGVKGTAEVHYGADYEWDEPPPGGKFDKVLPTGMATCSVPY
jgi:hypothetical protein